MDSLRVMRHFPSELLLKQVSMPFDMLLVAKPWYLFIVALATESMAVTVTTFAQQLVDKVLVRIDERYPKLRIWHPDVDDLKSLALW
jgi:hypothetical protein